MLGRVYSGVGYYDDAINALEAAHPDDEVSKGRVEKELGLAYRRRGKALNREADYDMAIQHLLKAVSLNSRDSDAFSILGGLYRRKGDYQQAYIEYETARRISPDSSYALGNLASLGWHLAKRGDTNALDTARHYFAITEMAAKDRIRQGQGEAYWDYYDLGLAQLVLGQTADAKKNYALAIQDTPGKEQFNSVLDNLYLLQKSPNSIPGLNDIIKLIEAKL